MHPYTYIYTHTLSSPRSRKGCLRKRGTRSHSHTHTHTHTATLTRVIQNNTKYIHTHTRTRTRTRAQHSLWPTDFMQLTSTIQSSIIWKKYDERRRILPSMQQPSRQSKSNHVSLITGENVKCSSSCGETGVVPPCGRDLLTSKRAHGVEKTDGIEKRRSNENGMRYAPRENVI